MVIAESAVHTRAQGAAAELAGADAILVGSALMRAADPPAKLREILSRPLVKVCGLTREEDVEVAVEAGADLCGFILEPASPRATDRALPFRTRRCRWRCSSASRRRRTPTSSSCTSGRRAVRGRDAVLLRGGEQVATVVDLPWEGDDPTLLERARAVAGRVVVAGGLGPDNVRDAIAAVRPWAVDASSSLEVAPGLKDHDRAVAAADVVARQVEGR